MKPSLSQVQEQLFKLIRAPEGVPKALASEPKLADLPIKGDERLSAIDRLDIYANMYFYRIRDALKEDFEAIHFILGDDGFHNLITDYLLAHPPTHYSIRNAGEKLPDFLNQHPLADHPYLADLATMEWAIIESFDAADASTLTLQDLQKIPPEKWGSLVFELVPCFQLLSFDWPVDQMREQALEKQTLPAAAKHPTTLIFWRRDFKVFYRRVDEFETHLFHSLLAKKSFDALCAELAQTSSDPTPIPNKIAGLFPLWIQEGILSNFK